MLRWATVVPVRFRSAAPEFLMSLDIWIFHRNGTVLKIYQLHHSIKIVYYLPTENEKSFFHIRFHKRTPLNLGLTILV